MSDMIPDELKAYPQWVLWREVIKADGNRTKLPYNAHNGGLASVIDPSTWASFDEAWSASRRLVTGIGFVLTDNDPYGCIDLDNPHDNPEVIQRHKHIIEKFDSYCETSPSGTGVHIWVKAAVAQGRNRKPIEIYTTHHYMTVTGWTFQEKPIAERGALTQILWEEIAANDRNNGNGHYPVHESDQQYTDRDIYEQAKAAQNGEKFLNLWDGRWVEHYKSQSEADFALINILGFYSRNVEQIKRMFFLSGLGQREKAKRKNYIDNMVQRSFDNQPAYVDLSQLTTNIKEMIDTNPVMESMPITENPFAGPLFENVPDPQYDWTVPPGILGEIAEFVHASAPRQVKEIALASAIGLMAGICGRGYNVSGTGLNQYILTIAGTGTGKEAVASGIDKLMRQVKVHVPAALDFIGPTEISSGQALIRYLGKNPCFVSIVGEFGLALQAMCSPNATSSQIMLKKKMLELYNKSGEKDVMQPTIYSEKEKNTQIVHSPAFSLLGESTPESYYNNLDESMISSGLLPRFLCIEYLGPRPALNVNHQTVEPNERLVGAVGELATNALMLSQNNRVLQCLLDPAAQKFADEFERITTKNINNSEITVAKELWNRAHLKMLKLAGLIAVGLNPYQPIITLECMQWSHTLVERDVTNIFRRFESGKIGKNTSEANQVDELRSVVKDYVMRRFDDKMNSYRVDPLMHQDRVISHSYLLIRLSQRGAFRSDRMGSTFAIARSVNALIADGAIVEVRQVDIKARYGKTMKAYAVTDLTRFT